MLNNITKIVVSNCKLEHNNFYFTITTPAFSKQFYFKMNIDIVKMPISELLLLPFIMCLYIGVQYKEFVIHIPEEANKYKTTIKKLLPYVYTNSAYLLKEDINTPVMHIKYVDKVTVNNYVPEKPYLNNYDCLTSASGGKDSLFSLSLIEDIGFKPMKYAVAFETIAYNRGTKPLIKTVYDDEVKMVRTNINRMGKFFNVQKVQKANFENIPYVLYRDCIVMSHTVWGLILAKVYGITQVFPAFEFSDISKYHNNYFYSSLSESMLFTKLLTADSGLLVMSLIYQYPHTTILKLIDERYYEKCKNFSSCLTQINRWCYTCDKCLRTWLQWKALNIDCKRYGFDETELFRKNKAFRNNSPLRLDGGYYQLSEQLSEFVKYNIIKNNPIMAKPLFNIITNYLQTVRNNNINVIGYESYIFNNYVLNKYRKKIRLIHKEEKLNIIKPSLLKYVNMIYKDVNLLK